MSVSSGQYPPHSLNTSNDTSGSRRRLPRRSRLYIILVRLGRESRTFVAVRSMVVIMTMVMPMFPARGFPSGSGLSVLLTTRSAPPSRRVQHTSLVHLHHLHLILSWARTSPLRPPPSRPVFASPPSPCPSLSRLQAPRDRDRGRDRAPSLTLTRLMTHRMLSACCRYSRLRYQLLSDCIS